MPIVKPAAALLPLKAARPKKATKSKKGTKTRRPAGLPTPAFLPPGAVTGRLVATRTQPAGSQWCWATCAAMVADFLDLDVPELEDIVQSAFNTSDLQRSANGPDIERVYEDGHVGGTPINCKYLDHVVDPERIDDALVSDMVVQIGVRWHQGGGHVVLITGFSPDSTDDLTYYYVNDPDPAMVRRTATYAGLLSAFGQGSWQETFSKFQIL